MSNILSFEEFYNSVWLKVPTVWREADDANGMGLQVLTYTMAQHMYYYYYSKIVYMDQLFDPDLCPGPYLKFLASIIGWDLIGTDEANWREQIKAAPLLYKIKGTKRGIVLAERLIGYSVFIADLYRDHIGEIVPKEMLWNNTPDSIDNKPWFRTITRDDSGNIIPGSIESDLPDSYNSNSAFLNDHGQVIRPLTDTYDKTLVARTLSTTSSYNPATGTGSLARYAKTPRINVVLKKLTPLDATDASGNVLYSNIDEAVSLLFEFKPFHVYVNNLEILVDLSDYDLGSDAQPTGGDGTTSSDAINYRENCDFSVYMNTDNDPYETISYQSEATTQVPPTYWSPTTDVPVISAVIATASLTDLSIIKDFQTANSIGFSPKNYITTSSGNCGYGIINGNFITLADFLINTTDAINTESGMDYVDVATRTIRLSSIQPRPSYSLRIVDISKFLSNKPIFDLQSYFVSKHSLFYQTLPIISNVTLSTYAQQDSVTFTYGNSVEVQNNTNNMPWDLKNLTALNNITGLGLEPLEYLSLLFNNICVAVLTMKVSDSYRSFVLDQTQYTLSNQTIVLDTVQIALMLNNASINYDFSDDSFLEYGTLSLLYLTRSQEADDFPITDTSRSMYLHSRNNEMFSRQYDVSNTVVSENSDEVKSVTQYDYDSSTGTLVEDVLATRVYRKTLQVYTRGSLRQQVASGTTPVIIKNNLNVYDSSQWKVYSKVFTSYYSSSQQVSNIWWTDFYQVNSGTQDNGYLIPYESIDTSYDSQEENRNSDRWQTAILGVDVNNPADFLVTRKSSVSRNAIWNRGSAARLAVPFIGDNRKSYQLNRNTDVLFTRSENLSDYATSISTPSLISNYKYVSQNTNIDVTTSYFNPAFSDSNNVVPQTEDFTPNVVQINQTNETQTNISQVNTAMYDNSTAFANRLNYYSNESTGDLYTSLYAGNMVIKNYPQLTGLMSDSLDILNIAIDGSLPVIDTIQVFSNADGIIPTSYNLNYLNPIISWFAQNTGIVINTGPYPSNGSSTATPNIKLFINGLLCRYNTEWTITVDLSATSHIVRPLEENDVITVEYFVANLDETPTSPQFDQHEDSLSFAVTQSVLAPIVSEGQLLRILLPQTNLMVSWYDSISGAYISTSLTANTLMPSATFETAQPDVLMLLNGFELKYMDAWRFICDVNTSIYIELLPAISYKLSLDDNITVKYQVKLIN
jgi:hypothetical protein